MTMRFADSAEESRPLHVVESSEAEAWSEALPEPGRSWIRTHGFAGRLGHCVAYPDASGEVAGAVMGYGSETDRARGRFHLAAARPALPAGAYRLIARMSEGELENAALGWLLSGYRYNQYRARRSDADSPTAELIAPEGVDARRVEAIAAGEALTRDLINAPASDMGPDELETAIRDLGARHDAEVSAVRGMELIEGGFPMIHAVGRASARPPRLVELRWGESGPRLTLVGKGVCFDTGGLNLKPGAAMSLMKKDMGGAAVVVGLASIIMTLGLRLHLRLLIPAVENAVGGESFRPGDILRSRKGLTVEIGNTDAEGRLVLADALAYADENPADLMVSMATLTGAARTAVGPDLAPFYASDPAAASALEKAGETASDPVWRMPFWDPYETIIEPGIADLDNAPPGGFAGSIVAALFLRRFVTETPSYVHFDIYGWQPKAAPGRPKGGVGQGARAILAALPELLGT